MTTKPSSVEDTQTNWKEPHVFQPDGNPDGNCHCGLPENIESIHTQSPQKDGWIDTVQRILGQAEDHEVMEKRIIDFIHKLIQQAREKVYQDIINALPETKDIVVPLMEKGIESLTEEV